MGEYLHVERRELHDDSLGDTRMGVATADAIASEKCSS